MGNFKPPQSLALVDGTFSDFGSFSPCFESCARYLYFSGHAYGLIVRWHFLPTLSSVNLDLTRSSLRVISVGFLIPLTILNALYWSVPSFFVSCLEQASNRKSQYSR